MLHRYLNVFEKIVSKHLHKSLRLHSSQRRCLRESISRKRPHFWQNDDYYILHDKAQHIDPNCSLCDFYLLPLMKKHLQGRRFVSLDEMKVAIAGGYMGDCEKWLPEVTGTLADVYRRPSGLL
ncbi:hypothetical protein TNCV_34751 [Trichonephila clavipes]|nr:hypothetical protein TNCV_34751 [Trichonephila clavipes]